MRILAATGPLFPRPMDWAAGVVAEAGFDGIELMVTPNPATQDPTAIDRAVRAEGLAVPVVHGPFLRRSRRVFGTNPAIKTHRTLELASAVGADLVVVHPPLRWQLVFNDWLIEHAGEGAEQGGVRIGVENMFPVAIGGRPARLHRHIDPDDLTVFQHVVLDTSHLGVAGIDLLEAHRQLGDRVVHVHLSDHLEGTRDSHAPISDGVLPLGQLLGEIGRSSGGRREDAGEPSITLEVDCRAHLGDREQLVRFLAEQRRRCLAMLDGQHPEA